MKSHRDYFSDFDLSVGEYGELLAAKAYRGRKRGHGQKGYDLEVSEDRRIEVKSKLAFSDKSAAEVVHCGKRKLVAGGMTHLLVIVVWPGPRGAGKKLPKKVRDGVTPERLASVRKGDILWAWWLSKDEAEAYLSQTTGGYISVNHLLAGCADQGGDHARVRKRLQQAAERPIWNEDGSVNWPSET